MEKTELQKAKQIVRAAMRQLRDETDVSTRVSLSSAINKTLWHLIETEQVQTLHTYLPMGNEVDVWPVLKLALSNGIKVITTKTLPKGKLQHLELLDPTKLEGGLFGTKHPNHGIEYTGNYDLVIVPGLAFNQAGGRIGYGAGYYDQFLIEHPNALKVAVCFPFQLTENLPQEAHDLPMDRIVFE
jgi:5-formyltetrahydrofolate cyclo-ligase